MAWMSNFMFNKANLSDLIAATGRAISLKLDSNCRFFSLCNLKTWWMILAKSKSFIQRQALCIILNPYLNSNWSCSPKTLNSVQNGPFLVPCELELWWMTLKNNGAPLLCCFKLCASFRSHQQIQTGVTIQKCSIRVKTGDFLSRVTLKFDGWHWKTIRHIFCAASSFVHLFRSLSELQLELQSGNAQFGSTSMIFLAVWPWETIRHLF